MKSLNEMNVLETALLFNNQLSSDLEAAVDKAKDQGRYLPDIPANVIVSYAGDYPTIIVSACSDHDKIKDEEKEKNPPPPVKIVAFPHRRVRHRQQDGVAPKSNKFEGFAVRTSNLSHCTKKEGAQNFTASP